MKRKIVCALLATAVSVSLSVSGVPVAAAGGAGNSAGTAVKQTVSGDSKMDKTAESTDPSAETVLPDAQSGEESRPSDTSGSSQTGTSEPAGSTGDSEDGEPVDENEDTESQQPSVTPAEPEQQPEETPEAEVTPGAGEEDAALNDMAETMETEQEDGEIDPAQIPQVMSLFQQWQQEDGVWYYYNADGQRATGWLEEGGNLYYLNPDGSMATGWQQIDGKWYYFRSWGATFRNELFTDPDDGNVYYALSDGSMAANTWIKVDEKDYYFRSWGAAFRNEKFTDPADGNIYYGLSDGSIAKNSWIQISGKWYYFRGWGAAFRNEKFTDPADGNIYYSLSDGSMATNTWVQIGGKWYYFRGWGAAFRDEIFTDPADGNIYYGLSDGSMATNTWVTRGNKRYYFRGWGAAFRNEKFTDPADGNMYYGSSDGSVVTDQWVQIGSDWYCFDSQGRAYRNQWFDSSEKPTGSEPAVGFYYVGSDGVMLKDTYLKTQKDGADYYYSFSGTGACNYADPQYVRVRDSVNGLYYVVEHQYYTDPQVSERDLMAAICAAEAGIQRTTGMTAVAMVIRNRMDAYGYSMKTAIYQQQQFEPARNGSLTRYLQGISSGTASTMQELTNAGAYIAADVSETIMNNYKTNGTNRVVPDFGDTREDFDYMYFMTPAAFERLNLDPEKCQTYTYTYTGTTSTGETYTSSHIFFVDWVRKS